MSDFYRNEYPPEMTPPGGYIPGAGGSWGGSGSVPGGDWGTTPGAGDVNGEWDGRGNVEYLKLSESGYLLKADNYLLTGTLHCRIAPQLIIWIGTDSRYDHRDCILAQLSPVRRYKKDDLKEWIEQPPKSMLAYRIDWMSGEFELKLKWQSGHYPHSSIGNMRVALFGVDIGDIVIPLTSWKSVATITISEDYEILVNGIVGYINGNTQYLANIG